VETSKSEKKDFTAADMNGYETHMKR